MLYQSVTEMIGSTPLLRLNRIEKEKSSLAAIYAKLERSNPAGSAKDRIALEMIRSAEESGQLKPGGVIIEPTSGNTGIGLAALSAALGYRAIIVMPDSMSVERIKLMRAYGAEVVLTESRLGMSGSIEKAKELQTANPGSIIAGQFENPANPEAHYKTTGPEIDRDLDGKVDVVVAGIGTGGTLSGIARYFKEKNGGVKIVGVEPASSPLLTKGYAGAHGLQGIGANFVPAVLDRTLIDEILTVTDREAFEAGRMLAEKEGVLVGISSGAALCAALAAASRPEMKGKNVVVILPDTGERYLSSSMFE